MLVLYTPHLPLSLCPLPTLLHLPPASPTHPQCDPQLLSLPLNWQSNKRTQTKIYTTKRAKERVRGWVAPMKETEIAQKKETEKHELRESRLHRTCCVAPPCARCLHLCRRRCLCQRSRFALCAPNYFLHATLCPHFTPHNNNNNSNNNE